jgi:hypothetical protein
MDSTPEHYGVSKSTEGGDRPETLYPVHLQESKEWDLGREYQTHTAGITFNVDYWML